MKYQPINSQLFIKNRAKFTAKMKPHGLAVFNSNDQYPIGADSVLPFQQARDIFYLSGIDQEESILLLFPDAVEIQHREILFLKETSEHIAIWEGAKLTQKQAYDISGISTVFWLKDFKRVFYSLMTMAQCVYFNTNEHYRQQVVTETREDRFIKWCKNKFLVHTWERSNPILQDIRGIKEPEEIALMQQACAITEKGFRRVLKWIKPGTWEYEVEAELMHEFLRNRSRGFAYAPVIASGKNNHVLHYTQNNNRCLDGDLLLLDTAAEYANYASDMTRTIPVNGRFSTRQRAVYNAVLRVKEEATSMLIPGVLLKEHSVEVGRLMTAELLELGLIDKTDVRHETSAQPAYKKYFMHGVSHHLGLDTHDYGLLKTPIQAHMVFTVEPAIYIPEEGFGIRLEDDVVISERGAPKNLMASIPILADDIEDLMNA